MTATTRKTLLVMLGIMALEGWPMVLSLGHVSRDQIWRLYTASLEEFWPAWVVAGAVTIGYVLYAIRGLPLIRQRFFDLHALKLLAVPFALISGTMEELWFRKLGMDWAQSQGASLPLQIALSAASFGLVHAVWGLFARRWRVALNSVIATSALGAGLAAVYVLSGRQVAPCIWSHALINLAIEPWLLMSAFQASSGVAALDEPGGIRS